MGVDAVWRNVIGERKGMVSVLQLQCNQRVSPLQEMRFHPAGAKNCSCELERARAALQGHAVGQPGSRAGAVAVMAVDSREPSRPHDDLAAAAREASAIVAAARSAELR